MCVRSLQPSREPNDGDGSPVTTPVPTPVATPVATQRLLAALAALAVVGVEVVGVVGVVGVVEVFFRTAQTVCALGDDMEGPSCLIEKPPHLCLCSCDDHDPLVCLSAPFRLRP